MNILLIEDDIQLNTTLTNFLNSFDHSTAAFTDGEQALLEIDKNNFDLYIIDINIPKINGLEIIKYIRKKDINTPVIVITASLELQNFKEAYSRGCSEYIKKPFYLEELEIRIDKLQKNRCANILKIANDISYDLDYEELKIHNQPVKLRKKERRLLTILLENVNKTVNTEVLHDYIWENEIKESYPLRQLVNDLRKKFNTGKSFIFADVGRGYRFEIKK
jgi:DNA-binding response OmpR family regulator